MKPSQLASQLRRIASAIDNSKNPDRRLVARDLKKVLASMDHIAAGPIVIHIHGDGEMINVVQSTNSGITSSKPFDSLTLPNGDKIIVAKDLGYIGLNMDMSNEALLDALFNAGLIQTDDDGNYLI